ncbi:MAG TPA: betaine/proline/choline family ABC transporter ATP-binding protein [Actinomycetota bacterium]|nr:betaine/proline/choline family ABC transporter ATP-binding protein [Actinomycetota bacterium]
MADPMISLRGVSKTFDGTNFAVRDLSFDVPEGETVVLVGPSGCGKTTTMKMINRLVEPSAGQISVNGQDVMAQDPVSLRRGIGYVIQSIGLIPHRTVAENIGTVPRLSGWDRSATMERTMELMDMFHLDRALLDRFPSQLSGGQRQRVGVARALSIDPPVMLMDEPFGAVDPIVRERLQDQFLEIQESLKKTIVFVTHDIDEAIKMADKIAILNVGGTLEQFDSPETILRQPSNEFVERFIGSERGLKRLGLVNVADVDIEEGPVVTSDQSVQDALKEMHRFGLDWVSVVDDGELRGWVDKGSLARRSLVGEAIPKPFSAYVTSSDSLRRALDAIVTSRTSVAVVVSAGQRYLGILTLERISREIIV